MANVSKYLGAQPVIGVNPHTALNPGVLVRHDVHSALAVLAALDRSRDATIPVDELVMVEAVLDDGQELRALNDIFLGHPGHQSARYRLAASGREEWHSSSGLIVGTGTGSTGWCASIALDRGGRRLPGPQDAVLTWFVREAWPSPSTGTSLTEGMLAEGQELSVVAESDRLVAFGDGMETDRLTVTWGQRLVTRVAAQRLRLAVAPTTSRIGHKP